MRQWEWLTSLTFDQYGPVLLLFGIMAIFLGACIYHSIVHKKTEADPFAVGPPNTPPQQKVVVTDGNTGAERQVEV